MPNSCRARISRTPQPGTNPEVALHVHGPGRQQIEHAQFGRSADRLGFPDSDHVAGEIREGGA